MTEFLFKASFIGGGLLVLYFYFFKWWDRINAMPLYKQLALLAPLTVFFTFYAYINYSHGGPMYVSIFLVLACPVTTLVFVLIEIMVPDKKPQPPPAQAVPPKPSVDDQLAKLLEKNKR